jgi:YD repeat-containing protein
MKFVFILLCCLTCVKIHAQDTLTAEVIDTTLNEDGQIIFLWNETNGNETYFDYDRNGKLLRTTLTTEKNGTQYDIITEYNSNRRVTREIYLYIINKKFYGKSQLDMIKEFDENGQIKSISHFHETKGSQTMVNYYPNGQVDSQADYMDGRLMNIQNFDDEGHSLPIGSFKDGNGELVFYKQGIQMSICRYKKGKLIKRSCRCD